MKDQTYTEYRELCLALLENIAIMFSKAYSDETILEKIYEEDNQIGLALKKFIVFAVIDPVPIDEDGVPIVKFTLSFCVDCKLYEAAEVTRLLTFLLTPEEFDIGKEYYYDNKKKESFFGSEAYNRKIERMNEDAGKIKCPICEKYYPKELFDNTKNEYCKVCNEYVLPNVVFH